MEGAPERKRWEYRVIHININTNAGKPTPGDASRHMHGALSPEFLQREFPDLYAKKKAAPHPAEQLQVFLNSLGAKGWEMVEAAQVGALLMFFFKREQLDASEARAAGSSDRGAAATTPTPAPASAPAPADSPPDPS
ncbi:hypothetical protein [Synechococcus sp. RSCCF101]|uniref:hypothetical protein n=1 Tax=Synechococcus sp. RSCCF101 TaxID=2511069 RepID=UPI001CDA3B86|nr:hypothetical protein [Synechococcus sp. RSCCF101]